MKIMVINCGSSSIKYQLFDADIKQVLAKGIAAKIGQDGSYLKYEAGQTKYQKELSIPSYRIGFEIIVQALLDKTHGVVKDLSEIAAAGHRVVHGGEAFFQPTVITEEVLQKIEEYALLAPLHNPVNLLGIREAMRFLPDVPHVAVFDTAFHQTMPPKAYLYALPYEYYETNRLRRYGFHGTSCKYVTKRAAEVLKQPVGNLKMVVCHLGSGITVAAVNGGKSMDTSSGFTPLPGVMMGTRSGDIDPGLIFFLNRELGLSPGRIEHMLNREGGLLGVSGVSNDMRQIIDNAGLGNNRCRLAMEMFAYHVKKYIGAYAAAMGGLDALVFTAGIGENSPMIRAMICDDMKFLGIELDESRNNETFETEQFISADGSKVKVLVIPTNEEFMIAMDTLALSRIN